MIAEPARTGAVQVLVLDADPADWVPEYPSTAADEPGNDRVRSTAEDVAQTFEDLPALSIDTKAAVGSPLPTILHELADGTCDLVVVGAADESDRRLAEKLSRKSPTSVLCIPDAAPDRCDAILTATDFSAPSTLALELAVTFGRTFGSRRLACIHSYRNPTREDRTAGLPTENLREAYRASAAQHLSEFLAKAPPSSLQIEALVREAPLPSGAILEELAEKSYDLVVMSTRGRSSIARALLGSNTAEVVRNSTVPVLAVKAKGEGLGFLHTLLGVDERVPEQTPATA